MGDGITHSRGSSARGAPLSQRFALLFGVAAGAVTWRAAPLRIPNDAIGRVQHGQSRNGDPLWRYNAKVCVFFSF